MYKEPKNKLSNKKERKQTVSKCLLERRKSRKFALTKISRSKKPKKPPKKCKMLIMFV
jgi:hypothetical protein